MDTTAVHLNGKKITRGVHRGSVYITGRTCGNLNGQINAVESDAFLAKYGTDGMCLDSLLGTYSQFYNVSVSAGPDGSVYVAGDTDMNLDGDGQSTAHSPESVSQFRCDDGFLS